MKTKHIIATVITIVIVSALSIGSGVLAAPSNAWYNEGNTWWYYNGAGENVINDWVWYGSQWYYLGADGIMADNTFVEESGKTYFIQPGGAMKRGWLDRSNGDWNFFNDSGDLAKNQWVLSSGRWYYMDKSGYMVRDKFLTVDTEYYINNDGVMLTGWINCGNGDWKHFGSDGRITKDQWVGNYYLGYDGWMWRDVWIGDWYVDDSGKWIPDAKKDVIEDDAAKWEFRDFYMYYSVKRTDEWERIQRADYYKNDREFYDAIVNKTLDKWYPGCYDWGMLRTDL